MAESASDRELQADVDYQRKLWRDQTEEALREVEKAGVRIYRPDQSAFAGAMGIATPAVAATQTAAVTANAIKPLVLAKLQDLDLGTVTLGPGT